MEGPDVKDVFFTVDQESSVTVTEDIFNYVLDSYTEIRKKDGSEYVKVSLQNQFMGNRKILPVGDYRLVASHAEGTGARFIKLEYEKETAKDVPVGGLRIKTMKFVDPVTDQNTLKYFDYSNNGVSSGLLFTPVYLGGYITYYVESQISEGSNTISSCDPGHGSQYLNLSTTSSIPLTQFQGSHIGYSKVSVFNLDASLPVPATITIADKKIGAEEFYYVNDAPLYSISFPFVSCLWDAL